MAVALTAPLNHWPYWLIIVWECVSCCSYWMIPFVTVSSSLLITRIIRSDSNVNRRSLFYAWDKKWTWLQDDLFAGRLRLCAFCLLPANRNRCPRGIKSSRERNPHRRDIILKGKSMRLSSAWCKYTNISSSTWNICNFLLKSDILMLFLI